MRNIFASIVGGFLLLWVNHGMEGSESEDVISFVSSDGKYSAVRETKENSSQLYVRETQSGKTKVLWSTTYPKEGAGLLGWGDGIQHYWVLDVQWACNGKFLQVAFGDSHITWHALYERDGNFRELATIQAQNGWAAWFFDMELGAEAMVWFKEKPHKSDFKKAWKNVRIFPNFSGSQNLVWPGDCSTVFFLPKSIDDNEGLYSFDLHTKSLYQYFPGYSISDLKIENNVASFTLTPGMINLALSLEGLVSPSMCEPIEIQFPLELLKRLRSKVK